MKPSPESNATFRKHLEQFIKIDDAEFEGILAYFSPKKLEKHQLLIRAGDAVHHTYWTKKGFLTSTFTAPDGKEHIIQFSDEGCWITDQNAFYHHAKAIFNISAVEDSELLSLSFENREKLCATFHKMEHFFRKKANDSFTKQQKRLLTYLTSDSQQRYELLLQEYPRLMQRLSKKTVAAYLGVSRETLSRFTKKG
ncbi:Crp/Fnr family transcriptional regulator [Chryseolinea soli]|uniref:Crp/Fnr family transcriptional regulator n=1 Tax=Chryseolinea soli TaxID=2321403 RepID=A0A385SZN8_9BACT|nr:Crp/Fnr family transcriptional regulator [Chryseolinea soli]AYB35290.1 Crp/Fnr family transcriptional regulator [Chryseolinea soli]